MTRVAKAVVLLLLCLPALAVAAVGRVEAVEGSAWRTPEGGQRQPLQPGVEVEQKDTLDVGPTSGVKLVLNDGSVLMVGADSQLVITEARFAGQERQGFSGYLKLGKVWAEVKKMLSGSEAKFEVKTDRAVAGVRGTSLRVDVVPGALAPTTVVQVYTGLVQVVAQVPVKKPRASDAGTPKPGERVQVPGPHEVSEEEWEVRFIELQVKARRQVEVGEQPGKVTSLDTRRMGDDFGAFVKRNGGLKKP